MSLLIVIVNYRTAELAIQCLRSLRPEVHRLSDVKVVIADNRSEDGSVHRIQQVIADETMGSWVQLVALKSNRGFAFGNNCVIREPLQSSDPPNYVLMLNPDTIVQTDAIINLVRFMDLHPEVGIAGSRLENSDGTLQRSAFRFHSIASQFDHGLRLGLVTRLLIHHITAPPPRHEAHETDWVSGASMIVRKEVFDEVGLLDDGYFMYFEEVDFCLSARRSGFSCWHVPQSRIIHLAGKSSPGNGQSARLDYWFKSRQRYFVKNHGWVYASLADAAFIVSYALRRIRRMIQRKSDPDPRYFLREFVRCSVFVRGRTS